MHCNPANSLQQSSLYSDGKKQPPVGVFDNWIRRRAVCNRGVLYALWVGAWLVQNASHRRSLPCANAAVPKGRSLTPTTDTICTFQDLIWPKIGDLKSGGTCEFHKSNTTAEASRSYMDLVSSVRGAVQLQLSSYLMSRLPP